MTDRRERGQDGAGLGRITRIRGSGSLRMSYGRLKGRSPGIVFEGDSVRDFAGYICSSDGVFGPKMVRTFAERLLVTPSVSVGHIVCLEKEFSPMRFSAIRSAVNCWQHQINRPTSLDQVH